MTCNIEFQMDFESFYENYSSLLNGHQLENLVYHLLFESSESAKKIDHLYKLLNNFDQNNQSSIIICHPMFLNSLESFLKTLENSRPINFLEKMDSLPPHIKDNKLSSPIYLISSQHSFEFLSQYHIDCIIAYDISWLPFYIKNAGFRWSSKPIYLYRLLIPNSIESVLFRFLHRYREFTFAEITSNQMLCSFSILVGLYFMGQIIREEESDILEDSFIMINYSFSDYPERLRSSIIENDTVTEYFNIISQQINEFRSVNNMNNSEEVLHEGVLNEEGNLNNFDNMIPDENLSNDIPDDELLKIENFLGHLREESLFNLFQNFTGELALFFKLLGLHGTPFPHSLAS